MNRYFLKDTLLEAINIAGSIQREVLAQDDLGVQSKYGDLHSGYDIVTEADIRCEQALRDFFSKKLPDHNILGEEFGGTYNSNGQFIIIDPVDGTKSFAQRLPRFGTIVGIYRGGHNVAGIVSNTIREVQYVATTETGFERLGEPDEVDNDVIFLGGGFSAEMIDELAEKIRGQFPHNKIITHEQDVLARDRVFEGRWAAYFHAGLAVHDIAAVPLFSQLTNVPATDHRGVPYTTFDAAAEARKYADGSKEVLYSCPILVSRPEYVDGMHNVLAPLYDKLDLKKQRGNV